MPLLNWSPGALACLRKKGQQEQMTRLFEAFLRVAGEEGREMTAGAVLPLELPGEHDSRYRFRAQLTRDRGWVVEASLKYELRKIVCRHP